MHCSPFPLTLTDEEDFPLSGEGDSGGLPAGYKRVEWLESPSKASNNVPSAFLIPLLYRPGEDEISIQTEHYFPERNTQLQAEGSSTNGACFNFIAEDSGRFYVSYDGVLPDTKYDKTSPRFNLPYGKWITWELVIAKTSVGFYLNGVRGYYSEVPFASSVKSVRVYCFGRLSDSEYYGNYGMWGRKKTYTIIRNGEKVCDLVPCLDPTGAPCMFDLVSRKPFYNAGTGDFLYPNAAPVTSTDLEDKFYGKLTEHGVRKLYKVPGYLDMTKDEYAAVNGFKELVEPPMPTEGYWRPEWRETETQLILEWIETEEPEMEEI